MSNVIEATKESNSDGWYHSYEYSDVVLVQSEAYVDGQLIKKTYHANGQVAQVEILTRL